jgi:hypothetical protein
MLVWLHLSGCVGGVIYIDLLQRPSPMKTCKTNKLFHVLKSQCAKKQNDNQTSCEPCWLYFTHKHHQCIKDKFSYITWSCLLNGLEIRFQVLTIT